MRDMVTCPYEARGSRQKITQVEETYKVSLVQKCLGTAREKHKEYKTKEK